MLLWVRFDSWLVVTAVWQGGARTAALLGWQSFGVVLAARCSAVLALSSRATSSCIAPLQRDKLEAHPLFERVSEEELESDPAAQLLLQGTEEGQKVSRNGGKTWRHVYRRLAGPSQQQAEQQQEVQPAAGAAAQ